MAATARTKAECKEFFDSDEVLASKAKKLAKLIREASHMIAFTGAGISTAAGIPDFRSGTDTVLKTGAGKWEIEAHNKTAKPAQKLQSRASADAMKTAFPTYTHMALKTLIEHGYLKCLVSQNTDGLHIRSGVPKKNFAELHGNRNLERCTKCKMEFLRDWRVRQPGVKVHAHQTGRKCESCGGDLVDTIVNFGENLPDHEIDVAFAHAEKADLALALGSSLTVTPAADVPADVGKKKNGQLVIVNLQKTPLDDVAAFRLNGFTDTVMELVMKELKLSVPAWKLTRGIEVELADGKNRALGSSPAATAGVGSVIEASNGGQVRIVGKPGDATCVGKKETEKTGKKSSTRASSARGAAAAKTPRKASLATADPEPHARGTQLRVVGFNPDNGQPHHYFKAVQVNEKIMNTAVRAKNTISGGSNTVRFDFPVLDACFAASVAAGDGAPAPSRAEPRLTGETPGVRVSFMGHYREPELELPVCKETLRARGKQFFVLRLNFQTMLWEVEETQARTGSASRRRASAGYHPLEEDRRPEAVALDALQGGYASLSEPAKA